jgi:hypothetical protein
VQLRANRYLDLEKLEQVRKALDFATNYYIGETHVPKKIAMAMLIFTERFLSRKDFLKIKC